MPRNGPSDAAYAWPYTRMPGVGGVPWVNDRTAAERYFQQRDPETARFRAALYAREAAVRYRPGTLLLYRLDTWHRGAPLKPGGPVRRVLNLVYARSDVRHITAWNCRLCLPEDGSEPRERAVARAAEFGFCRSMYFGAEDVLNRASVDRKSRLGVPPPGHPYWTRELHTAVASRFPDGAWGEYATGELRVERQAEQAERVQA